MGGVGIYKYSSYSRDRDNDSGNTLCLCTWTLRGNGQRCPTMEYLQGSENIHGKFLGPGSRMVFGRSYKIQCSISLILMAAARSLLGAVMDSGWGKLRGVALECETACRLLLDASLECPRTRWLSWAQSVTVPRINPRQLPANLL